VNSGPTLSAGTASETAARTRGGVQGGLMAEV
jgi:hypothetical protein